MARTAVAIAIVNLLLRFMAALLVRVSWMGFDWRCGARLSPRRSAYWRELAGKILHQWICVVFAITHITMPEAAACGCVPRRDWRVRRPNPKSIGRPSGAGARTGPCGHRKAKREWSVVRWRPRRRMHCSRSGVHNAADKG